MHINAERNYMKKHKWIIILVILVLLVMISAGNNKGQETRKSVEASSDSLLSYTPKTSTVAVSKEEKKISYKVGEEFNNKFLSVTMTETGTANKSQRSAYIKLPSGTEVIYAKFSVKNVGKSESTIMYTDFSAYADDSACDQYYALNDMGKTGMDFAENLSAGRKITGTVAFIVPKGTKKLEIEYKPNVLFADNVIFKVK